MATLTPTLSLSSTDLLSDALSFSTSTSFDASHTSGLARANLTSVSKVTKLSVIDGDADVADASTVEGQYIDITDNHGLKKRYVFTTADGSGAADGTIIVDNTDIGSTATPPSNLIGGICVNITNGDQQRDILEQLRSVINHANGHNGSITAAAVAAEADGPQSCTMTNPTVGESAVFHIDAANATWIHVDNTGDAAATNSQADHVKIVDKVQFTDPAVLYIKNTAAYHASNGRVFLYYDNHGAEDVMELRGQQFAYLPMVTTNNLFAYTSTSGTVVEFMAVGTEA
mgnify:FL=1|tara:strand:+ start:50 stop:907 length:858 start_codon:yes stop_codon:yes gene_type:complete